MDSAAASMQYRGSRSGPTKCSMSSSVLQAHTIWPDSQCRIENFKENRSLHDAFSQRTVSIKLRRAVLRMNNVQGAQPTSHRPMSCCCKLMLHSHLRSGYGCPYFPSIFQSIRQLISQLNLHGRKPPSARQRCLQPCYKGVHFKRGFCSPLSLQHTEQTLALSAANRGLACQPVVQVILQFIPALCRRLLPSAWPRHAVLTDTLAYVDACLSSNF